MAYAGSGGDIAGIGDANLVVTGNLTVRNTQGGKYVLNGAKLLFEGGSVRVDGNTDLSVTAVNSGTAGYSGRLAGIYAIQGNSSHPTTEMTFGKDANSTFHIHDIHLTSTQQQAEAYGIRVLTGSVKDSPPPHQSHIVVNSKAIIENIKAVSPNDDFAYAAGVEASESARVEFKSDLTVRNIAAINGSDIPGLTSGTSGSDAEAYSLIALNGGQIDVNAAGNAAYTVQIEGDMVSVDKDGSLESRINASFMNEQSYFKGLTNDPYNVGTGKIDLTFANNAYWIVPEDNELRGTLTLQNGRVYVGGTPDMFASTSHNSSAVLNDARTLTLDNLACSGGIFYLRADIANDNADRIVVKNGKGNYSLMVRSTGAEPSVSRMNTYLASLENGSANFTLANRDGKVDAGTFQYILKNENTASGKGWYLAQDDGSDPLPQPTVPDGTQSLTPAAETALSLSNSNFRMRSVQVNNLHIRTRDLRQHALSNRSARGSEASGSSTAGSSQSGIASLALNVWADSFGQTGRFKSFEGSRYDQDVYGLALGADKQFREKNAVWFLGARG